MFSAYKLTFIICVFGLTSCGGGGGGVGSGSEPDAPPQPETPLVLISSSVSDYFPIEPGTKWKLEGSYFNSGLNSEPSSQTEIYGLDAVGNIPVTVFDYLPSVSFKPSREYLFLDSTGLRTFGEYAIGQRPDASVSHWLVLKAPIYAGDIYQIRNITTNLGQDLDGDEKDESVHLVVNAHVIGTENLSLRAGTIKDAIKIVYDATATVTTSKTGQTASAKAVETDWYGRGLGIVKKIYVPPATSTSNAILNWELAGMQMADKTFGRLRGFTIFDDVAPYNYLTTGGYTIKPAVAVSDLYSLAAVDRVVTDVTSSPPKVTSQTQIKIIDAKGKLGSAINIFQPSIFDGNFYTFTTTLAAATKQNFLAISKNHLKETRAQRISFSGELLDGPDGFPIGNSSVYESCALNLTADTNNYYFLCTEPRGAPPFDSKILLYKLDSSGQVVWKSETFSPPQTSIAVGGDTIFLVWSGPDPTNTSEDNIYARRISSNGSILDVTPIAICTAATSQYRPKATFDGTNFIVMWADGRSAYGYYASAKINPNAMLVNTSAETCGGKVNSVGYSYFELIGFQNETFGIWKYNDNFNGAAGLGIYGTYVSDANGINVVDQNLGSLISGIGQSRDFVNINAASSGQRGAIVWADSGNHFQDPNHPWGVMYVPLGPKIHQ